MKGVHAVSIEVPGKVGGAADAADSEDLVGSEPQLRAGLLQAAENPEVSTTRAPVRVDLPLEVLRLYLYRLLNSGFY